MAEKKSAVVKILWGVGIAVALLGLSWRIVPEFGDLRSEIHGEDTDVSSLTNWLFKCVEDNRPNGVWNAMHESYREQFSQYFRKVRDGNAPADGWDKVVSADKLKDLDDRAMFRKWWKLSDRSVVGFRLPAFLRIKAGEIESVLYKTVYLDERPAEAAREGFLYYQVNGVDDLLHFSRQGDVWRLDVPTDLPAGM